MDPDKFLDRVAELKLAEFLAKRSGRAHIIAPGKILDAVRAVEPNPQFTMAENWRDEIGQADNLFVFDDSPGFPSTLLSERYPGKRVHVINHEITLQLACRQRKLNVWRDAESPRHRFGVLATPRSGSTFLINLLMQLGLGHPIEHVRPPMVQMVKDKYPFDDLMRRVESIDARNGVFGTKFISTFVLYIFGEHGAGAFADYLKSQDYKLVRLRRNISDQAVSSYVANESNLWHVYGDKSAVAGEVAYDYAKIKEIYERFRAEHEFFERVVAALPSAMVHNLDYADLEHDPERAAEGIKSFLGFPVPEAQITLSTAPRKISRENTLIDDFRARFAAELQQS